MNDWEPCNQVGWFRRLVWWALFAPRWKPRTVDPPGGLGKIWASDGERVWVVWDTGRIPPEATAVQWWAPCLYPGPPKPPGGEASP